VVLDPAEAVRSLSEVLERVVPADVGVTWTLEPAAGWVQIDHGQFEQLVLNLAINARDAMPDGGRLHIAVAKVAVDPADALELDLAPGGYVRISVSDTGSGMDEETSRRCFEPLYTTKGATKGTGLGLPAVKRVVLEGGGAVRFDTEPGRGTTFDVYLPAVDEYEGRTDQLAPSFLPEERAGQGTETVLVAEDDDGMRRLLCRVLSHSGYQVLEASSGTEALMMAAEHQGVIDVLVSDVVMPGADGREVAMRLREDRPDLAVLLVSGSTDAAVLTGLASAPVGFLPKPFKPSDVVATIRQLLDEWSTWQTTRLTRH
jgi:CheY-like chemotaxis protein